MNGTFTPLLFWAVTILVGMVNALIGIILKMHADNDEERLRTHSDRDDERFRELTKEVDSLRTRLHDLSGTIGKVDQWQRFRDEDKHD